MTKVARLFEEEKVAFANALAHEAAHEATRNAHKKFAAILLAKGVSVSEVMLHTGFSNEELSGLPPVVAKND